MISAPRQADTIRECEAAMNRLREECEPELGSIEKTNGYRCIHCVGCRNAAHAKDAERRVFAGSLDTCTALVANEFRCILYGKRCFKRNHPPANGACSGLTLPPESPPPRAPGSSLSSRLLVGVPFPPNCFLSFNVHSSIDAFFFLQDQSGHCAAARGGTRAPSRSSSRDPHARTHQQPSLAVQHTGCVVYRDAASRAEPVYTCAH